VAHSADDVLAAVRRSLDESVVGKAYSSRPPAATEMPYTVLSVSEGDDIDYTGGGMTPYRVTATVYSREGQHDRGAIEQELKALDWFRGLTLPGTDAAVVHVRPIPGKVETAKEQLRAADVMVTTDAWEVMVNQPDATQGVVIGGGGVAIGGGTTGVGAEL
jgi:hypothetical protein